MAQVEKQRLPGPEPTASRPSLPTPSTDEVDPERTSTPLHIRHILRMAVGQMMINGISNG